MRPWYAAEATCGGEQKLLDIIFFANVKHRFRV
jgi:hypothetical protein